jgi:hypothetical protein
MLQLPRNFGDQYSGFIEKPSHLSIEAQLGVVMRFSARSALLFLALVSATAAQEPLSFIHQIRSASSTVCVPFGTAASVIDVRIDWGDTVQQNVSTRVQCNIYTWGVKHVYSNAGNYTVTISAGSGASPWLPWFGHASLSSTVELDILSVLVVWVPHHLHSHFWRAPTCALSRVKSLLQSSTLVICCTHRSSTHPTFHSGM